MLPEQLKNELTQGLEKIIIPYLKNEKEKGTKIDNINPWKVLEENRLKIAKENMHDTLYPMTVQGGTVALLFIEQQLRKTYFEEYQEYFKNNPIETKIENIYKKETQKYVDDIVAHGINKDEIIITQALKLWGNIIENYRQYLSLRLVRRGEISIVQSKNLDLIKKTLEECLK